MENAKDVKEKKRGGVGKRRGDVGRRGEQHPKLTNKRKIPQANCQKPESQKPEARSRQKLCGARAKGVP